LVLAVLAHQLRVIVRQSRFLEASNRALEMRGAELESKVDERTEALQDAVTELEAFNYSVSHDLRSPLGAILNFTTILEEDHRDRPLDGAGIALIERIRRSANRAMALLEDLLKLSRAGRSALDFETIDMAALARETFAQVRVAEGDDEIEFIVEPLPEAIGDRTLLGDVFANLFSNALKYSRGREKRRIRVAAHERRGHDGPGRFTELEPGTSDRSEVVYTVSDNGHGFDMRFADKLFRLFERLHTDDEIEGTGVGLAMVARIVKRHGGRVQADSRPGEGACLSFSLPRREPT
jgi:two-component system sensor kinase